MKGITETTGGILSKPDLMFRNSRLEVGAPAVEKQQQQKLTYVFFQTKTSCEGALDRIGATMQENVYFLTMSSFSPS